MSPLHHTLPHGSVQFLTPQMPEDFTRHTEPLIPQEDFWPIPDTTTMPSPYSTYPVSYDYSSSSDSHSPSCLYEATPLTRSPSPSTPTTKTASYPYPRIPRPANAFILFRSEVHRQKKISREVESDHRKISEIIGKLWKGLTDDERRYWHRKADCKKAEHSKKYPGYRYTPSPRLQKPMKRKTKRNGPADRLRCEQVAELVRQGMSGGELDAAVKAIDGLSAPVVSREKRKRKPVKNTTPEPSLSEDTQPSSSRPRECRVHGWKPKNGAKTEEIELPVFRSPLLPPASLSEEVVPPQTLIAEVFDRSNLAASAPIQETANLESQPYHAFQLTTTYPSSTSSLRQDQYIPSQPYVDYTAQTYTPYPQYPSQPQQHFEFISSPMFYPQNQHQPTQFAPAAMIAPAQQYQNNVEYIPETNYYDAWTPDPNTLFPADDAHIQFTNSLATQSYEPLPQTNHIPPIPMDPSAWDSATAAFSSVPRIPSR